MLKYTDFTFFLEINSRLSFTTYYQLTKKSPILVKFFYPTFQNSDIDLYLTGIEYCSGNYFLLNQPHILLMAQATEKEREIHRLLLSKDDLAFAKFCDEYYEPIYKKVHDFNKIIANEYETLLMDIVTDTFLKYFKDPTRFNPEKQTLEKFLIMDAEGDLKNELQKIKRQNKNFSIPVELEEKTGNSSILDKDLNPADLLINKEAAQLLEEKLKELFSNERDILVAHLMLLGERRSIEYAKVLELEKLDIEEQRIEIKRQKDRIDKVIRRKLRSNE